ncbi:MAG TPA: enoyl-CoA hydratase/isomerase family protein [Nevskia sp.]|nr:enoyl-CoA hydratase/isomerase family protein [Nevskia sp.]
MADPRPASLAQVLAWASDADARRGFSPLSDQPFLLFEAEGELSQAEQARIRAWLHELPCPSLAVTAAATALTPACDVVLESAAEAEELIGNISRSPIAAAVLVQLLRATETLAIADALTAESLAYSTLQAGPEFRRWLDANRAAAPAVHSDEGPAVVMEREDAYLSLELNRASNRNGMTVEMRDALVEALQLVLSDDSIHQVRISGRGKCFSTGGDLTEFGSAPDPATAHLVRSLALPGRLLAACAARVEVRLHGACIGSGVEFPAFAGRIVAWPDTHFQLPELRFGLIPGAGGCVSIARRIGRQRTAWLVLSGERIRAAQALDWGLVDVIE